MGLDAAVVHSEARLIFIVTTDMSLHEGEGHAAFTKGRSSFHVLFRMGRSTELNRTVRRSWRHDSSNSFARYWLAAFHTEVLTFTQPLRAPDR